MAIVASDQEEKQKCWQEEEGMGTGWAQEGRARATGAVHSRTGSFCESQTHFIQHKNVWTEGLEQGPRHGTLLQASL